MKKKQINTLVLTCSLLIAATLIIYGCKKSANENLSYEHYERVMATDANVVKLETDMSSVSKAILTEAYLKRPEYSGSRITNSLKPFISGKMTELTEAAKKVKTEEDLKIFLSRIGLQAQSENYVKLVKSQLATMQKFYNENPDFKELPKEQQIKLLFSGMKDARAKQRGYFRKVQDIGENDPCWDDWSEAIEDAQDDQFWEVTGASVAFVLCVAATEGVGTVFCYDGYVAATALAALKYADAVTKADDRYNKCAGDNY